MALFRILKGTKDSFNINPSQYADSDKARPSDEGTQYLHDGWAYVVDEKLMHTALNDNAIAVHEGTMYVDVFDHDANGNLVSNTGRRLKLGSHADKADNDGSDNKIVTTYLSELFELDADTSYTKKDNFQFTGSSPEGDPITPVIIPLHSADAAGLITPNAQTITGNKTFANHLILQGATATSLGDSVAPIEFVNTSGTVKAVISAKSTGDLEFKSDSQWVVFNGTGKTFYPDTTNAITLGNTSHVWKEAYATKFIGDLEGNADTATALTSSAGSVTQPIFFEDGKPKATTYALNKTVPSNALFTDTTYTFSAGTANGTFTVTPKGGTAQTITIPGLGAAVPNNAVFTDTTYTFAAGTGFGELDITPSRGTKQTVTIKVGGGDFLPLTGGTLTGPTTFNSNADTTLQGKVILGNNNYGEILPTTGIEGQVFYQLSDGNDGGVPKGGTTGQVLVKKTAADFDYAWEKIEALPAGGTVGQILVKNSATDGDASWTTLNKLGTVTIGGANQNFYLNAGTPTAGNSFVPTTGGTFSGDITIKKTSTIANNSPATLNFTTVQSDNNITTTAYIKVYDDHDTYASGTNMLIQSAGNMIIGAGESPNACYTTDLKDSTAENMYITSDNNIYFYTNCNTYANKKSTVYIDTAGALYGAVWNDYAEYRQSDITEPGRVVFENGDDTLSLSAERLQRGCEIISDTFGFVIGETDECKTPIATSGRVLAYPLESREEFATHIGWPVCSGPNGTVSLMTEEEEEKYPSRIIGVVSAVPDYEEWGTGNVKVNGRVWVRIR